MDAASSQQPTSPTAEAAAFGRAIESLKRGKDRLVYDPFARLFIGQRQRRLLAAMRVPGVARLLLSLNERRLPGVLGNLLCRTRFIDEILLDALRKGIQQVVLLGAGFDSRPYRIAALRRLPVFELDRPPVLSKKRSLLELSLAGFPSNVSLVGFNFREQHCDDALLATGFDMSRPAFFIWEGVTQYLTADAIEDVFRFVGNAAAGSEIAFSYIDQAVIDGHIGHHRSTAVRDWVQRLGEDWISGFVPNQIKAYLAARRLAMLVHAGAMEYRRRYLEPLRRSDNLYEEEYVVVARIGGNFS